MKFLKTEIEDCYLITYDKFKDNRGYFCVPYQKKLFDEAIGREVNFIQDNQSYSKFGTIRGLHFQTGVYEQAKLVTCVYGRVYDVVVDIRKESKTFGKSIRIELSDSLGRHLFVPRGCAHGFSTLSDFAIFQYKVDNYYNKESERGIIYNDEILNIDWGLDYADIRLSDKDLMLPSFISL